MQDIGKVMGILKTSIESGTADMGVVSNLGQKYNYYD